MYACSIYSPSDLIGPDSTFSGGSGGGGRASGGTGGFSSGALGGTGAGGAPSGGSSGKGGGVSVNTGGSTTGGKDSSGGVPVIGGGGNGTAGDESGGLGGAGGSEPSSGGTSTGGTGGGTTTGGATGGSPPLAPELVDDMEDGNQNILIHHGRNGAWYTAAAPDASALPEPMKSFSMAFVMGTPAVADSARCFQFTGKGGSSGWGAMAAFDFRAIATPKVVYDASAYKGISFWVKAAAAVHIAVRIPIKNTTAEADGSCKGTTAGCENHYGADVALTTSWKQVTLLWPTTTSPTLAQDPAWGHKVPFTPNALVSMQFVVVKDTPSTTFLIDDVAFVP